MDTEELDALLHRWSETKSKLKELETKCEKYKKLADKMMRKNNSNALTGSKYTVSKREITKTTISKQSVPPNIWEKYHTRVSYPAFYLQKK